MIYFGKISYIDPYKDDDTGTRQKSIVFSSFAVEAANAESAAHKIADRIIELTEEDERYQGIDDFFLEDLVELEEIGPNAKEISWVSMLSFGDTFARMAFFQDDDPECCHYLLRAPQASSLEASSALPEASFRLAPAVNEEGEEGSEAPLVSLNRDRKRIRPLYKELCKQKLRGTLPEFSQLSDGDLYELYVVEGCLSGQIADLFDIKQSKVDYRRRKIDATVNEEALYALLRSFDMIEPIPYKGPSHG